MSGDALSLALQLAGWLALLVVAGAIGFAVITATIARATSAQPGTLADELLAAAREALVAGFLAVRFPFDVVRRRWSQALPDGADRVVLLLPGYMETDALFWRLRRHLRAAGLPYVTARYPLVGDPYLAARRVAAQAEQLAADHGLTRVDLVGHSMGGLIGRYVAENLACPAIGRVVSIASPHAGTLFGPLGVGVAARQLRRGAPFVSELADPPDHLALTNLCAPCDNIVAPRESAQLGACDRSLQGAWGHNSAMFSAACCQAVVRALTAPESMSLSTHEYTASGSG